MSISLLALALIAAPMAGTLTLDEARAMSVPELAERVLGMAGESIREVRIDSDQAFWPVDNGRLLKTIWLAEAPRRAGPPGLCAAKLYQVQFEPVGAVRADGQTPVHVVRMFREDAYKIVASPDYPGGRIDDSTHVFRDAETCPGTGPVLWQFRTTRRSGFFTGSFENRYELNREEAWFISRALHAAQRWRGPIACGPGGETPVPWLCGDPRAMLASGAFWGLGSYEIHYCRDRPETLCVTTSFDPGGEYRQVNMIIATTATRTGGFDPLRLRSLTLEGLNGD